MSSLVMSFSSASIPVFSLETQKCNLSFVPSLAPTRLLCLVEQQTECKTVELVHEVLDLWLLEQLHVQGNDLADNVAQALVASGCC